MNRTLGRIALVAVLAGAVIAGGPAAEAALANNTTARAMCHPGSTWANDPPRIIAWPWYMQRTPGYDATWISLSNSGYILKEYTEQWLYFRVWANGVPGAWIAGFELGAAANPLNTFVEVRPGVWSQAVMYPYAGDGPEDVSFLRLSSRGGTYQIWFEYCWMPIYVKGTNQLAYAGQHTKLYGGVITC
jgi:hypothetical protein